MDNLDATDYSPQHLEECIFLRHTSSSKKKKITGGKYVVLCYRPAKTKGFYTKVRQTNVKFRKVYRFCFIFFFSFFFLFFFFCELGGWGVGLKKIALTRFWNREASVRPSSLRNIKFRQIYSSAIDDFNNLSCCPVIL